MRRIHCGIEVTELSTNKQLSLSQEEGRQEHSHCDSEDAHNFLSSIFNPPSLPRLCWQGQREQKKSASCTWCCTQRHRRLRLRSLLRGCCLRHLENERKIRSVSEVQCPSDRAAPNDRARAAATFARVRSAATSEPVSSVCRLPPRMRFSRACQCVCGNSASDLTHLWPQCHGRKWLSGQHGRAHRGCCRL